MDLQLFTMADHYAASGSSASGTPPNHSKVSGMRSGIKIGAIGDNVGPRCHGAAGGGGVGKRTRAVLLCESA
jgi:hypothetical protein